MPPQWSGDQLVEALLAPGEPEVAGTLGGRAAPPGPLDPDRSAAAVARLATVPCLVVAGPGWAPAGPSGALVDVVAGDDDELADVAGTWERAPVATAALALHLRGAERRGVADGLVAESALYSALQAGPEHAAWRAANPPRRRGDGDGPRLRAARHGHDLLVTLSRPEARNALDVALRDQLLDALAVAEADPGLHVVVAGEGPSFCAGGDLDEFGTAPDPATAHLVRLRRSLAAALHRLAPRTTVLVHGPCAGSGVELPAFAGEVIARADATFVLPELALGLIPGAGGTVSLPRRIGRRRTAWLACTGRAIDAATAERWGLVDRIDVF